MAAPMELSAKEKKKLSKKIVKLKETLNLKENICFNDNTTKIICLCNGGLDNNVSMEEVKTLATDTGGRCEIMMIPQKSYCYVCFDEASDAESCCKALNGYKLYPTEHRKNEVILYALFVSTVPDNVCPSTARPNGLILLEDYITEDLAAEILQSINWSTNSQQSQLKHRRVKHYGYEFKYSINNVDPDEPLTEAIPEIYKPLLEKLKTAGIINHYPDQLTINEYQPGQGIPPHVDTPSAFEDGLVSLSIGSQVLMEFRHPDGRHLSVLLPHRSVLVMTGESRYIWSHGITPRKSDIVPTPDGGLTLSQRAVRTSFTFRKITGVKPSPQQSEKPAVPDDDSTAAELENLHVYQVYEKIADHFSGTRHSPWPRIAEFVRGQSPGSLLVDIGCGNGKYFGINPDLYELGSDRSFNLSKICQKRNFQIYVGDVLAIPLREATFDVCLCIAVIHHLSTQERRRKAVSELLKVLMVGGKALIYVWAIEQELNKVKSKYLKGAEKDGVTPVANETSNSSEDAKSNAAINDACEHAMKDNYHQDQNHHGSLATAQGSSGCLAVDVNRTDIIAENTDNQLCEDGLCTGSKQLEVHVNRTKFKQQDVLVPWQLKNKGQGQTGTGQTEGQGDSAANTFHRFYHVFHKGELEELCMSTGLCKIVTSYYDQGNWAVILEKT